MNIDGKDLAKLTEHMPGVEMFFRYTPHTLGMRSSVMRALETIDGDDDLLQRLAIWLMGTDDVMLPACVGNYRMELEEWRRWLREERDYAPNSRDRSKEVGQVGVPAAVG